MTDPEKERMRAALHLIAEESCDRLTSGPGSCWSQPTWSPEAEYGADRWCDGCIALAALLPVASTPLPGAQRASFMQLLSPLDQPRRLSHADVHILHRFAIHAMTLEVGSEGQVAVERLFFSTAEPYLPLGQGDQLQWDTDRATAGELIMRWLAALGIVDRNNRLTFEQFQRSGRDVADLVTIEAYRNHSHERRAGRVYQDELYIVKYSETQWWMPMEHDRLSTSLRDLEVALYDFYLSNYIRSV